MDRIDQPEEVCSGPNLIHSLEQISYDIVYLASGAGTKRLIL